MNALNKRIPARLNQGIPAASAPPLNTQLLVISLFAATGSFLVSLSWQSFLNESVNAVQRVVNHKIPIAVSKLVTAIIVTALMIGILTALYRWEKKATEVDEEYV